MCHASANLFRVDQRDYICECYFTDLVLIDPNQSWTVSPENILYKWAGRRLKELSFRTRLLQRL